jgi:hypothetical protein
MTVIKNLEPFATLKMLLTNELYLIFFFSLPREATYQELQLTIYFEVLEKKTCWLSVQRENIIFPRSILFSLPLYFP